MVFFSETNVMIKILHNLALFWVKNTIFSAEFFWQKYFKNHNIGPWNSYDRAKLRLYIRGRFLKQLSVSESDLSFAMRLWSQRPLHVQGDADHPGW
jgi:hypothetical protein